MADIIPASLKSKRTFNPIRSIVDNLKPPQNHPKRYLNLALGDPTVHGNLQCPDVLTHAIQESVVGHKADGYLPSTGSNEAKHAIAQYTSRPGFSVEDDDVILTSGCSGAVELVISALINEGDNILAPCPGFPLYEVVTNSLGGHVKHYNLNPDSDWEADLTHLSSLIDSRTRAILICNPSNPCGSVYSPQHLAAIASIAREHSLPVIADEIYGGCVFEGTFTPFFTVAPDLPVLSLGGLAKEFIVPGWRVGWLVIQDGSRLREGMSEEEAKGRVEGGRLREVKNGLKSLSQLILGASSLIQAAIPRVLTPAPGSEDALSLSQFSARYLSILRENAELIRVQINSPPSSDLSDPSSPPTPPSSSSVLRAVIPQGAMYAMMRVDTEQLEDIENERVFAEKLLQEENLILLPGSCFGMPGFVRVVTCPPPEILLEALGRLREFCERHLKK